MAGRLLAENQDASELTRLGPKACARSRADLEAMRKLVAAKSTDLHAPIPHGDGQTILREALLIADHNAYHIGRIGAGAAATWRVEVVGTPREARSQRPMIWWRSTG